MTRSPVEVAMSPENAAVAKLSLLAPATLPAFIRQFIFLQLCVCLESVEPNFA